MSHRVRGVPSKQQTRHASRPIAGPRRKPQVLSQVHTRPKLPVRVRNYQIPLCGYIYLGLCTQILNSSRAIPLVRGPPRRRSPLRWLQLSDRIPAIHGISYAGRLSPCSKRYNAPTSMRVVVDGDKYLCMIMPTIKQRDLGGYEKITTCKSRSCGDPKYSYHQLWLHRVYVYLDLYRERVLES